MSGIVPGGLLRPVVIAAAILFVAFGAGVNVHAQETGGIPGYSIYGKVETRAVAVYAKDSPVVSDFLERGTWSLAGLSRLAATHRFVPGSGLGGGTDPANGAGAELVVDHAILVLPGSAVEGSSFGVGSGVTGTGATGTGGTGAATASGVVVAHELYQAYVSLRPADQLVVRVGRQRLNWGMGYTWSVTDGLHPQSADSEVEPGFDGGSIGLLVSPDLSIELAVAAQDALATGDLDDLRTAGYTSAYLAPVDVALSVVHQYATTLRPGIGVSFPIGPVLLAGEAAIEAYDPRGQELNTQPLASVGGEYTWYGSVADLVLMAEYIYNGLAETYPDPLLSIEDLTVTTDYAGGFQRPGRHYAAAGATISVLDSWSTDHQVLANLSDESYLVRHGVRLERVPGVDLSATVTWTAGDVDTEFGVVPQGMGIELAATVYF